MSLQASQAYQSSINFQSMCRVPIAKYLYFSMYLDFEEEDEEEDSSPQRVMFY